MLIYPAIDLLDGRCVLLRQGRFDEAVVHSDDPLAVARGWVDQGAEALHIVDLDGARLGKAKNLEWIYRIRERVDVRIEVGGGVRTFSVASRLYEAGIDRLVFGTAAIEDPRLLYKLLDRYGPDQIAAALDLRDGRVVIQGRGTEAAPDLDDVLTNLGEIGLRWVVCTDVTRDGTLIGPDLDLTRRITSAGFLVIIGGGVATVDDVATIRRAGAAGCIIGTALYGGMLALGEAIEAGRAI
ncbi:MAG: 1-(5-phosphoribosyl)-5-[(5-phosphoribosylamino)methylideneamino] imidazole-4-carboxamide isomerase [Gemmatimonadota bacterium]|nr:MAG: 1-(5-phosphoribosyl)-5-[(5-phosphoribosylamino)methylideneamino] imidazole-4-carboxamide isomerase [Gemmatimonadota bacterium]